VSDMEWRSRPEAQAAVLLYVALENLNRAVKRGSGQDVPLATKALADALDVWPALRHEVDSARSATRGYVAARNGAP